MVNRQYLQTPHSKMNKAAGNVDYLCSKYLTEMSVVATITDLAVKEAEKPPPLHAAPPTPREDTPPPRMGVIPLGFGPDVPDQLDEETKLLFGYLRESKSETTPNKKISIATSTNSPVLIRKQRTRSKNTTKVFPKKSRSPLHQATAAQRTTMSHPRSKLLPIKSTANKKCGLFQNGRFPWRYFTEHSRHRRSARLLGNATSPEHWSGHVSSVLRSQ